MASLSNFDDERAEGLHPSNKINDRFRINFTYLCTIQEMLHNFRCRGVERNISQCKHHGWRRSECNHYEDAGVKCHAPKLQDHKVFKNLLKNYYCILLKITNI